MAKVATGIVGCGISGADIHKPVVETHPGLDLVAMCDRDASRLAAVAEDVDRTYRDLNRMLAEEDLDSVHVCTPPGTHLPIAEQVMEAGIPVLIEKPAATGTDEVEQMVEARDEAGVLASVIHNKQFAPFVQEALEGVADGRIGDVVSVTVLFAEPRDLYETDRKDWVFDLPGGEIGEGIVHQVYLPLAFVDGLGGIDNVSTQNFRGYEDPISFDGLTIDAYDGTGDRTLTIKVLTSSISSDKLVVHGTEGEYTVDFLRGSTYRSTVSHADNSLSPVSYLRDNLGLAAHLTGNVASKVAEKARGAYQSRSDGQGPVPNPSHYEQIDRHAQAIAEGGAPPVTLEEAYDTISVLEAIGERTEAGPGE